MFKTHIYSVWKQQNLMNFSIEEQQPTILKVKKREYKCPCGKSYLSNPALFTHVKLKHRGEPPGQLQKPKLTKGRKGRPPIYPIKINKSSSNNTQLMTKASGRSKIEQQKLNSRFYDKMINTLKSLISNFEPTQVYLQTFYQFECFRSIQAYFDQYCTNNMNCSLAQGIRQFYHYTIMICEFKFQIDQIYLLLILMMQYIIDECNNFEIIWEAPIDFILNFFNEFIGQYSNSYHFQNLQLDRYSIFKPRIVIEFLCCLYNWMKYKNLTERNVYLKLTKNN